METNLNLLSYLVLEWEMFEAKFDMCLTVHHRHKWIRGPTRCNNNNNNNNNNKNNKNLLIFKSAEHVLGNSMPILRSARLWITACSIMPPDCCRSGAWSSATRTICSVWRMLLDSGNILCTEHIVRVAALQASDRQQSGGIIPHAVIHNLALLRMGIELPETCWADLKINKFLLLHLFGPLLHFETKVFRENQNTYFIIQ